MSRFAKFKPSKTVAVGIACAVVLVVAVTLFTLWSQGKALPPTDLVQTPSTETSESAKPKLTPEEDTPEYQFWANFCGNIRILMSSGGVEWHINLLPGEKIGLSSPNIDSLIATKRPYFEKMFAQGEFSADTPRDFRVAIKERCTRLG